MRRHQGRPRHQADPRPGHVQRRRPPSSGPRPARASPSCCQRRRQDGTHTGRIAHAPGGTGPGAGGGASFDWFGAAATGWGSGPSAMKTQGHAQQVAVRILLIGAAICLAKVIVGVLHPAASASSAGVSLRARRSPRHSRWLRCAPPETGRCRASYGHGNKGPGVRKTALPGPPGDRGRERPRRPRAGRRESPTDRTGRRSPCQPPLGGGYRGPPPSGLSRGPDQIQAGRARCAGRRDRWGRGGGTGGRGGTAARRPGTRRPPGGPDPTERDACPSASAGPGRRPASRQPEQQPTGGPDATTDEGEGDGITTRTPSPSQRARGRERAKGPAGRRSSAEPPPRADAPRNDRKAESRRHKDAEQPDAARAWG